MAKKIITLREITRPGKETLSAPKIPTKPIKQK